MRRPLSLAGMLGALHSIVLVAHATKSLLLVLAIITLLNGSFTVRLLDSHQMISASSIQDARVASPRTNARGIDLGLRSMNPLRLFAFLPIVR